MTADSGIVTVLVGLNLMLAGWIVIFLAAGFGTRWARVRAEARRARFAEHWETVLYGRIAGDTEALPKLARRDDAAFLLLWLHLAGYVRDEGEDGLRAAGTELGFDKRVIALLGAGAPWERLLAARAAALLRLDGAATPLQRLAAGRDRTLALAAVEALLKIDPALGHASFLALVLRGGWSPCAMVAAANACPAAARRALEEALARARPGAATAVVRLLELIEDADAVPALRARLAGNRDGAETAALLHALGRFGDGTDRRAALSFLRDARPLVRMQTAFLLGMLGRPDDLDLLSPLLGDPEWWVRYRAAEAALRLARGDRDLLAAMMDQVPDRFARDAMAFAVAEFEWHPAP